MSPRINRGIGFLLGCSSILLFAIIGCKKETEVKPNDLSKPAVQLDDKKDNTGKRIEVQAVVRSREMNLLSFDDAVKKGMVLLDPPSDELGPPDVLCNGKISGKIYEKITSELWDKVAFTHESGKRIQYQAVMTTELGDIHLDLFGEAAPCHVRNFICLARTGYFDGMKFYYSLNTKIQDNAAAYIESGCPRGTGEIGSGSIGYWLTPEISDKLSHEEGMLGACLNGDPNTASSRFYITAAKMPQMDGDFTIFGKVTQGLDIVRRINRREVHKDIDQLNRLKEPVLIRSVTIRTTLAES